MKEFRKKARLMILLTTVLLILSCTKEELDTASTIVPPKIEVTTDAKNLEYIQVGDKVTITIKYSGSAQVKIKKIGCEISSDDGKIFTPYNVFSGMTKADTTLEADSGIKSFVYTMPPNNNYQIRFTLTDANAKTLSATLQLYPVPVIFTSVKLGAQKNTTLGSFFSPTLNTVYNVETAKLNQNLVDFCFYIGKTDSASIACPAHANVQGGSGNNMVNYSSTHGVQTWTTKREVKFRKATTPAQKDYKKLTFKQISAYLRDLQVVGEARWVERLKKGDVYYFYNDDGKHGVFEVEDVDNTYETGSITISGIIQR